jgi:NAD(P)-dependent dehydrogenase (short-subunit alcohol dehydrogenase family)
MRSRVHRMRAAAATGLAASMGWAFPTALEAQSLTAEPPPPSAESLANRRVVLITGSTSGLGRELALTVGQRGAHVIVHGRNRERGLEVVEEILADGRGTASFYAADLASLDQVRALGEAVLRDYERLDVLVNNAGIWLTGDETRYTSDDGVELSFAVNYLSHFVLTDMLLPIIPRSPDSRIVNVASGAQTPIDFDDPMLEEGYAGGRSYAQSKLAQVMHAFDLAEELEGAGIKVNSLHPATLMDTFMVRNAGVTPRSTVEEGLEAVLNLIDSPDVGSGGYYSGLRPARANAQAYDEDARAALRRLSEELVGT